MNKDINSGKGFLQDKLGDYQVDPPPVVWDHISTRLSGKGRGRKIFIILSAAASLALAITLGITWSGRDIPKDGDLATSQVSPATSPASPATSPVLPKSGLEEKVVEVMAEVAFSPSLSEETNRQPTLLVPEDIEDIEDEEVSVLQVQVQVQVDSLDEDDLESEALASETLASNDLTKDLATEDLAMEDLALVAGESVGDEIKMDLEENVQKDLKWVLGAMVSPLYSYRDAQPEAVAGTSGQESGMVSYAAGVKVGYMATRRLAIESGVFYNKMGISIGAPGIQIFSEDLVFAASPAGPESAGARVLSVTNTVGNIVSNSGEIYVNNYLLNASKDGSNVMDELPPGVNAEEGIQQHLDYLELPFNLRYTVLDRDFKIQLLGGMSTNLLVNNYVSMESGGVSKEIGYLTNIRNVNYSGNAGLGFVYHFLDQLSLSVEPRFRYYLNSVNDATLPSTRPYTFGIYTGINYFF